MRFNRTYYSLLFCCLAIPFSLLARDVKSTSAEGLQGKPMLFIENKGQIVDQNNNARNDVQFKLSNPGLNILIGKAQLHYQFAKKEANDDITDYRIDMSLAGANLNANVITGEQQGYFERYLLPQFGKDGAVAHSYNRITYKNIYPNIDWVLYIKDNQLEYDFILHEGANPKDIQLKYEGATNLNLSSDGSLIAKSPLGTITEKAPVAYIQETGKTVASKFELHDNTLSFNTEASKGTLVIDPVLKWNTYFGGPGSDNVRSLSIDPWGNIYAVGQTASTSGIATSGAFQTALSGSNTWDIFIAKYNPKGNLIWATYFGGTGSDYGYGVATDGIGKVYICGNTTSSGLATVGQTTNAGPTSGGNATGDALLAKFDSSGQRIWSTYKGGCGNEQGLGLCVNSSYQVFLTGNTMTGIGNGCTGQSIATVAAYSSTTGGGFFYGDAFLAKYDTAGNLAWCTLYGSSGDEAAFGVTSDAAGNNIYIAGYTTSPTGGTIPHIIATTGAYQTTAGGGSGFQSDAFLACFDGSGSSLNFGTFLGGTGTEQANGIAIDGSGNVYIAGTTSSTSNIAYGGVYHSTGGCTGNGCPTDGFLAKFSGTGAIGWSTYIGGDSIDAVNGVAVDQYNNVWIVGSTRTDTAQTTPDAYQLTRGGTGSSDAFIASFNGTGTRQYATYIGGSKLDVAQGVACSPSGTRQVIVLGGNTSSNSSFATSNASQTTYGGAGTNYGDGFVAKFAEDTIVYIKSNFNDTLLCAGQAFTFQDSVNHNFLAGNTFTVQLSNAAGSFAAPVNIGSVSATTAGNINATIPAGTAVGNGYRIRIVSTNPVDTSAAEGLNIQVFALIAPTATNNGPICVGDSLYLYSTNTNVAAVTFSWTGPLGFSAALQNTNRASVSTSMAGTYTVTLAHAGCTSVSGSTTVTVSSVIPSAPTASSNSPVCQFQTLNLNASSSTNGITYIWTGPNGFSSTSQNPTITNVPFAAGGNYYAQVNLNGCRSARDTVIVTISPSLIPAITISANPASDSVCQGHPISFTATTTNGGNNPTYQWYDDHQVVVGAISGIWGSPFLGNGDSVYCVLTISSSGACVSQNVVVSNTIGITVLPTVTPVAFIYVSPGNTVSLGTSVTFTSYVVNPGPTDAYQWSVNGVAIPAPYGTGSTFTSQALMDSAVVTLTVYSSTMCADPDSAVSNSIVMHISNNTGVKALNAFSDVNLYPNPTNGTFSVKGFLNGINNKEISLEMMNSLGQIIYSTSATVNNSVLDQKVSVNVADGIYMLRIKSDEQSKSFRVVVQH